MVVRFLVLACILIVVDAFVPFSAWPTPRLFEHTAPGGSNSAPGDDDEPHVSEPSQMLNASIAEPSIEAPRDVQRDEDVNTRLRYLLQQVFNEIGRRLDRIR
jgi:hypothetical protein